MRNYKIGFTSDVSHIVNHLPNCVILEHLKQRPVKQILLSQCKFAVRREHANSIRALEKNKLRKH